MFIFLCVLSVIALLLLVLDLIIVIHAFIDIWRMRHG